MMKKLEEYIVNEEEKHIYNSDLRLEKEICSHDIDDNFKKMVHNMIGYSRDINLLAVTNEILKYIDKKLS